MGFPQQYDPEPLVKNHQVSARQLESQHKSLLDIYKVGLVTRYKRIDIGPRKNMAENKWVTGIISPRNQ